MRPALYRPFYKRLLYFDPSLNEEIYSIPSVFPTGAPRENVAICISAVAATKPFHCLMTDITPDVHLAGDTQCLPFYTYTESGARRENIADEVLEEFRSHYGNREISKWDIFHYVYAVLHHPTYRNDYGINLRRELPRVPLCPEFSDYASSGKALAELHCNFENLPEYPLRRRENSRAKFNLNVQKIRFGRNKASIVYNEFLTLEGMPLRVFEYRLGTFAAIEWIAEQVQLRRDPRSGLISDPNRKDDPEYIIHLLGKVITVSLETLDIVGHLPQLDVGLWKKTPTPVAIAASASSTIKK